ncbi:hypothetical protein DFQ28_001979 [Apophysomyces sp. BC1034]|nr:hypothetical protein DFQ30_002383 [Apophysomyces sp. BC1015]KAG0179918.1 hypothetical protein DFQ29_001498 [Apophysomyces sp. BC1021]KAG0190506.1 hypothetical protein DFQ28_001979 [Apophysomyces sp. BC1034]
MQGFPSDCYFYIKSLQNGSVLDVYQGQTSADTAVVIWPQKGNDNDNQLWRYEDGFLVNKKSNLVLDIRGGDLKPDRAVIQYDRKMTMAHNQRWGYRDGFVYILADPRLVLDIKASGGSDRDGAKVILYTRKDDDNENQKWTIVPFGVPPPQYQYQPPAVQANLGGYGPPDDQNPAYGAHAAYGGYAPPTHAPIPYEQAHDAHKEVYQERKAHLSHQVIAGAAAYQAVKAYMRHQEREGKEVRFEFAKKAIAALAAAEVVKLAEEHDWSGDKKEQASREAERAAEQYLHRELPRSY